MKCSALFVLDDPSYFIVFMFYVVFGVFGLLIANDLQCKLSKLNLTFLKTAQNIKMKIELRKKWKQSFYSYFTIISKSWIKTESEIYSWCLTNYRNKSKWNTWLLCLSILGESLLGMTFEELCTSLI